jgi:hypothetical protein
MILISMIKVSEALAALCAAIPADTMISHVDFMRNCIRSDVSSTAKNALFIIKLLAQRQVMRDFEQLSVVVLWLISILRCPESLIL